MATLAPSFPSHERSERLFFLCMAWAIAGPVVIAFALFWLAGISTFGAPWWVHVHALSFMGWIAFYVVQNTLAWRNDIALHRRLGLIGAGWAAWMVLVGLVLTPVTLSAGRAPPFFTPPYFLALDWINIVVFGALFAAGFAMRKRTDWHRRLMLCATVCVMAPAWGRLIVLSGNPMTAPVNIVPLMLYLIAAALFDWRNRGSVHPAYAAGALGLGVFAIGTELLATLPSFAALADGIVS